MQIARLQLQRTLEKGVREPAAARIERTLSPRRPSTPFSCLNQEQRNTSAVAAMTPKTCPINSRKVPANWCARIFVVSLVEDMQGTVQRVTGELVWQSLAEALQHRVIGHNSEYPKGGKSCHHNEGIGRVSSLSSRRRGGNSSSARPRAVRLDERLPEGGSQSSTYAAIR